MNLLVNLDDKFDDLIDLYVNYKKDPWLFKFAPEFIRSSLKFDTYFT